MHERAIRPNDTIKDVIDKLHDPRAYLAGVIEQMRACEKEHGNAAVRIGVTGSGQYPCYRVVYEAVYGVYIDSHKPFVSGGDGRAFWSGSALSLRDVEALQRRLTA